MPFPSSCSKDYFSNNTNEIPTIFIIWYEPPRFGTSFALLNKDTLWSFFMKQAKGFTIIELVVIIVIMGILATIAVPGFSRWLPNYRLRAAARDVFSNLQHAKLTAIKRHRTCAISFNQDIGGTVYDYVIYEDADSDLDYDSDASTDLIDNDRDGTTDEAGESELVVTAVLFSERYKGVTFDATKGGGDGIDFVNNDDGNPTIGFLSNGFTIDNGGNPVSGSVFLINPNGRERAVAVSAAGNITIIE